MKFMNRERGNTNKNEYTVDFDNEEKQMAGGQRTGGHLSENALGYQIAIGTASGSMGQT